MAGFQKLAKLYHSSGSPNTALTVRANPAPNNQLDGLPARGMPPLADTTGLFSAG